MKIINFLNLCLNKTKQSLEKQRLKGLVVVHFVSLGEKWITKEHLTPSLLFSDERVSDSNKTPPSYSLSKTY